MKEYDMFIKTILRKNKIRGLAITNTTTYWKALMIKKMWCQANNK